MWDDIRDKLTYREVQGAMARARKKYVPPMPANFEQMAIYFEDYEPIKKFYRGYRVASDGSYALVFASSGMLKALKTVKVLLCDGTFEVRNFCINYCYNVHKI